MALLFVGIAGTQAGKKFDLASGLSIGREAGNTICLPNDGGVSRKHARIFWLQGLPMIEDLGSRNGTFLNGGRISQARPVSSGDEVRVGAEVFRVEAAMDQPTASAPQNARVPGQEVSRGEGRGRRGRRPEQGSPEGTLYKPTGGADPGGCAMPEFDLSGCLRYLWLLLIILIIAAVLALLIGGIGALLSAAGGMGAQTTPPSPSQPAPQNNPPPPGGSGGGPAPQQQPQTKEGIVVVEVKIDFDKRGGDLAIPVVLVKWANGTRAPVTRLIGTIRLYDRDGKLLSEIPRETLYDGQPVPPGETHEDSIADGGVGIRQKLSGVPATGQVQIDKVE